MKIPMVDLRSQYLKIKEEIDTKIFSVIENTEFINGTDVKEFNKELAEYINVKYSISCANGTDALQIALMSLDLEPGDEIISTDFTFIATVETIALLKLTPVMVDVDPDTYLIDPELIEKAITPRTKAIIPVHLFGQCADMDKIMKIAEKYNLYVIEDLAQAIGSTYYSQNGKNIKAGAIGHIACTSFFPSKNLGCYGDGGAIFTNDDNLFEKISSIANHGMKIRYYHDRIGVNSRLDTIQAAVLRVKLKYLDDYNNARQKAAKYYDETLIKSNKITIPKRAEKTNHTFHQYVIKLDESVDRNKLMEHLNSKGIASAVYYPVPLHKQKAFQQFKYNINEYPVTDKLCETVLALPINTELNEEILKYITNTILEYLENI